MNNVDCSRYVSVFYFVRHLMCDRWQVYLNTLCSDYFLARPHPSLPLLLVGEACEDLGRGMAPDLRAARPPRLYLRQKQRPVTSSVVSVEIDPVC